MSVLVVSATKAEAAHVPSGLKVVITGVGKVAAASAVSRVLASDRTIKQVVNVGSCGALRDGHTGIYEVGTVLNHDLSADAIRALGYEVEDALSVGDSDIVCATGDLFVSNTDVRERLAARAHLVDMEAFAVAWAAREAGVPARVIKHVSDNADESALAWVDVVDRSARDLAEWLADNV